MYDQRRSRAALPRGKAPATYCTRGRVGAENLASTGIRFPDRPARCGSLYMLRYPGPHSMGIGDNILCLNRGGREAEHSPPPTTTVKNK